MGEYPLARYSGECAASTASLWINHMPPRTTRKSYRPRVSDRTMVGIYNHAACLRQKRKASSPQKMNHPEEKNPRASQHDMGWKARRTNPLLPVAGEIFPLTFPFIERANLPSLTMSALSNLF